MRVERECNLKERASQMSLMGCLATSVPKLHIYY
jgi:hypothetical protein